MTRLVTVRVGELACAAIAGDGPRSGEQLSARVVAAIRCYLNDKGSGGLGWSYPSLLVEETGSEKVPLRLAIDDELWRTIEEEAGDQGVSAEKLVTHAALYVAAEVDAGRVTRRILDDLGGRAEGAGA